jgi:hypothetical protein
MTKAMKQFLVLFGVRIVAALALLYFVKGETGWFTVIFLLALFLAFEGCYFTLHMTLGGFRDKKAEERRLRKDRNRMTAAILSHPGRR